MVLQVGEPTVAVRFLTVASRTGTITDARKDAEGLRTWWLGCSLEARNLLVQEESMTPYGRAALNRARRFLVESDLEAWVDSQNVDKGITPHSALVMER